MADMLTVEEVAEYLRITPHTAYKMLRSGELKGIKAGREWRVHRKVLEAFAKGESEKGDGEE